MPTGAHLSNTDALLEAKAALTTFAHEVGATLAGVDAEMQRCGLWIHQERPAYWKAEIRRREDEVQACRREIERKVLAAAPDPASTVLERKALDAAKRRVDAAREKQESTRRWSAKWDKESLMYKGAVSGLAESAAGEIVRANERLNALIAIVDQYMRIEPPTTEAAGLGEAAGLDAGQDAGQAADQLGPEPETLVLLREDDVPGLRRHTPSAEVRAAATLAPPPEPFLLCRALRERDAAEVQRLEVCGDAPDPSTKVLVAWNALPAPAVILARDASAAPGDGGWTILPTDNPHAPGGWLAVTQAQLTGARPDLVPLLRLRAGCLVVLAGGAVRYLLNDLDRNVWSPST